MLTDSFRSSFNDSANMYNNNTPSKLNSPDEFVLEHVHGVTSPNQYGIAANPVTDQVAYAADRILVVLNPITSQQMFIETPSLDRSISCVAFSNDGRLVGFAEHGPKPYVSVWLIREFKQLSQFQIMESKRGPSCIKFHPKKTFVIMIGQEEPSVTVYDYLRGVQLAIARLKSSIYAMDISQDGNYLLVCGHRKIRYYMLNSIDDPNNAVNVLENKRAVSLGCHSSYTFIGITCGKKRQAKEVYTITSCGFLCKLKLGGIFIERAEKIDTHLSCLCYGLDLLFLGCRNSTVKLCYPEDLSVAAVISLSEMLGPEIRIPGLQEVTTQGIVISEAQSVITCVYSDYNIYSWQVKGANDSIECNFILPSYLKKVGADDSEAYGSLKQELFKTSILKQYVGGPTQGTRNVKDCVRIPIAPLPNGYEANAVKISPDCKDIVVGDDKGELKVYYAATGTIKKVIEAHNSQVTYIEMMYDDDVKLVCSGGRDRVIFVLDAADNFNLVQVLCEHSAAIKAIKLLHCDKELTLVSAAVDGVILIRKSLTEGKPQFHITSQFFDLMGKNNRNVMQNFGQTFYVKGSKNGGVHLFNIEADLINRPVKKMQNNSNSMNKSNPSGIKGLDIDPSGSFLAVGFVSGYTTVYHLQTGQIVATLSNQRDLQTIKFTEDLFYMIIFSKHCALVWKLPERMAEYMRSRMGRENQSETRDSDDIPFDTFLKCSRVCRGTSGSDTSFASGDRTPTIKSMNLLNASRSMSSINVGGPIDEDLLKSGYSSSSISTSSSSTRSQIGCRYTSSDASVRMNSMPDITIKSLQSIYSGKTTNTPTGRGYGERPHLKCSNSSSAKKTCIRRSNRSASYDGNFSNGSLGMLAKSKELSRTLSFNKRQTSSLLKKSGSQSSTASRGTANSKRPSANNSQTMSAKKVCGPKTKPLHNAVGARPKTPLPKSQWNGSTKCLSNPKTVPPIMEKKGSVGLDFLTFDVSPRINSDLSSIVTPSDSLASPTDTQNKFTFNKASPGLPNESTNQTHLDNVMRSLLAPQAQSRAISPTPHCIRTPYFLKNTPGLYEPLYQQANKNASKNIDNSSHDLGKVNNKTSDDALQPFSGNTTLHSTVYSYCPSQVDKYKNPEKTNRHTSSDPCAPGNLLPKGLHLGSQAHKNQLNKTADKIKEVAITNPSSYSQEQSLNLETQESYATFNDHTPQQSPLCPSKDLDMNLDNDSLASLVSICNRICSFKKRGDGDNDSKSHFEMVGTRKDASKIKSGLPVTTNHLCRTACPDDSDDGGSTFVSESFQSFVNCSKLKAFNHIPQSEDVKGYTAGKQYECTQKAQLLQENANDIMKTVTNVVTRRRSETADLAKITESLLGNKKSEIDGTNREQPLGKRASDPIVSKLKDGELKEEATLSFSQRFRMFTNKKKSISKNSEKEQTPSTDSMYKVHTKMNQTNSNNWKPNRVSDRLTSRSASKEGEHDDWLTRTSVKDGDSTKHAPRDPRGQGQSASSGQRHNTTLKASGTAEGSGSDSFATLFKQDDYLKRLKDIRENFEKNIEALHKEREHSLSSSRDSS